MIIGHLPAGYLCAKGIQRIFPGIQAKIGPKRPTFACLLGSVLPDIDMLYYLTLDHKRHLHHSYWTHTPLFWFSLFSLCFIITATGRSNSSPRIYCSLISANVFLHLILDSVAGKIRWLFPFSSKYMSLCHVPAGHISWLWDLVFHWTFLIEIGLCLGACVLLIRSASGKSTPAADKETRSNSLYSILSRSVVR